MYSKGTKVNSPTLLKLTTIKRDLSQCLQEEKRQSKPTKTSTTTNQFASSRTNETNSILFVPFEAFYVVIEDAEGLHCPIFKEYPLQLGKDEPIGHFKVPRLPYPIFYWESPIGQCPFIPPLMNETTHGTRKSSQLAQAEKGEISAKATAAAQVVPVTQDLRARALRNSTASKASLMATPAILLSTPKFVFEPAMTDTSIITAKTNLYKQQHRQRSHAHVALPPHLKVTGVINPVLKITPNISINVNRAVASATTPKHVTVSGNLRKAKVSPIAAEQEQQQQQANASSRKKEKNLTAAHRARPGFCECCCEKYSDLEKHVKEPVHRQFALQSDNYEAIDNFLGGLKRPYKAEYLLASYKAANEAQVEINENYLLDTSLIQNSPISPTTTTTTSHVTTARNYTTTKKSKQSIVSKRIKMIANTTTSSYLDEEDAEASGVVEVLSAANTTTAVKTTKGEVNYISSPSCKRRKSFKLVQ